MLQVFAGGSVCYGYTTIPTYPSGQIGMMVCCKGEQLDVRQPRQPPPGAHPELAIPPLRSVEGWHKRERRSSLGPPVSCPQLCTDACTHIGNMTSSSVQFVPV